MLGLKILAGAIILLVLYLSWELGHRKSTLKVYRRKMPPKKKLPTPSVEEDDSFIDWDIGGK